jgi:hypothetical protein
MESMVWINNVLLCYNKHGKQALDVRSLKDIHNVGYAVRIAEVTIFSVAARKGIAWPRERQNPFFLQRRCVNFTRNLHHHLSLFTVKRK